MVDNLTKQVEEVETLSSIYGQEWVVEDESHRSYSILITEGHLKVILYIKFPPDYPSDAPPVVQISAPELGKDVKQRIIGDLNNIYLEHIGESVVFQWVEKTREILNDLFNSSTTASGYESLESELKDLKLDPGASDNASSRPLALTREIKIHHGNTIIDRKSIFQGHAVHVEHAEDIQQILMKLYENKKIANATHNMYAYRIFKGNSFIQDCDDDGETHAGGRMLHLLQILGVKNVLVVVTRWFGGILLGPDRFRHINNATRQVLIDAGFLSQTETTRKKK